MTQPSFQTPGSSLSLVRPSIPGFEGMVVAETKVIISGTSQVDTQDTIVSIDDRVRLVGDFRCVGVSFEVDKNGDTIRVQKLKPIEVTLCPWDPTDVNDNGIVKARP